MQFSFDPTTTEVALTPKPFIPTFETLLARSEYTMRLPTYRSSYGRRFHPYPRYAPPRTTVDELMVSCSPLGFCVEYTQLPPSLSLRPLSIIATTTQALFLP